MNANERAAHLCEQAQRIGMDAPSEDMIADAIHNAIENEREACEATLRNLRLETAADALRRRQKRIHAGIEEA